MLINRRRFFIIFILFLYLISLLLVVGCNKKSQATSTSSVSNWVKENSSLIDAYANDSIVAKVNGTPILYSSVVLSKERYKQNIKNLEKSVQNDESLTSEIMLALEGARKLAQKTEMEILDEHILREVEYQYAVKEGFQTSYEDSLEVAQKNWEQIKKEGTAKDADKVFKEMYGEVVNYMKHSNLSEKDYIVRTAEALQKSTTRKALFEKFCSTEGKGLSTNEQEVAYASFLMNKASSMTIEKFPLPRS